jgi:hypothetical protein
MSPIDRGIYQELARTAGALRVDLEALLANGLGPDDRALAPQYAELVDRLKAVEGIARGPMPDQGLIAALVVKAADLVPMTPPAKEFLTAVRTFLVAARATLAQGADS